LSEVILKANCKLPPEVSVPARHQQLFALWLRQKTNYIKGRIKHSTNFIGCRKSIEDLVVKTNSQKRKSKIKTLEITILKIKVSSELKR